MIQCACVCVDIRGHTYCICMYRIAGMFGEFGESYVIRQTKTIQISTYNK